MKNGEKIKATFPHYDIEIDEHKGYVRVFYEDFYTTYPLRWWNAEYREPTTKTCKTCRNFGSHHGICEICKDNKCWTEKEPTTKNDLAVKKIVDVLGSYTDLDIPYKHKIAEDILNNLPSVTPQESQTFKWCDTCKEYDQEKHCCHRYSKVIRDTVEEMKQEPRKGHWEHGRELSRVFIGDTLRGINYEDWHCSNCHCVVEQSIKPKWNFCPNCGADMRKVEG